MNEARKKLLDQLGYSFRNILLFKQALTHASTQEDCSYERLEFLGDRILGLIVAQRLYTLFLDENEGDLAKRFTQLVSRPMLVAVAKELNLSAAISFAGSLPIADSVLADVCEALIAALYLDGGFSAAEKFVSLYWEKYLTTEQNPPEDPKTQLQEWVQAHYKKVPCYEVIQQSGRPHAPIFVMEVSISSDQKAIGRGLSKRQAEHQAAKALLERIMQEK